MPSFSKFTPADMDSLMAFLANPAAAAFGGGRGGRGGAQVDACLWVDPVVASGPAPASVEGGGGRGGRGLGGSANAAEPGSAAAASKQVQAASLTQSGGNVRTPSVVTGAAIPIRKAWKFPTFGTTARGPFPRTPSSRHGPQSRPTI